MEPPRREHARAPSNAGGRGERALLLVLVVAYGWFFVYFERLNNPNEMVRLHMVRAMVHSHTYAIGRRVLDSDGRFVDEGPIVNAWGSTNDRALVCDDPRARPPGCTGTLYSVKAPGTSLVGAPVYAALRGATRLLARKDPTRAEALFFLRLLLVALPSVALWLAVRRFLVAGGIARPIAQAAAAAGGLGSLSLPYGQLFAGHQPAAIALAAALLAIFWPPVEERRIGRRALVVGLGAAGAVAFDYQSAPPALLLVAVMVAEARGQRARVLAAAALGALLPSLALAQYHTACFGAPWRTAYRFQENPGFAQAMSAPLLSLTWPTGTSIAGSLVAPFEGLFFWSPWIALVLGAPLVLRRSKRDSSTGRPLTGAAWVSLAVVAYYLAFQVSQTVWRAGWVIGPRYVTPLVPFAAIAIAVALDGLGGRARAIGLALLGGAAVAAIHAFGLGAMVARGFPGELYNPLVEAVGPLLRRGYLPHQPLEVLGVGWPWGALPYLAALASGALLALGGVRALDGAARRLALSAAIGLALLLAAIQWSARTPLRGEARSSPAEVAAGLARLEEAWEPAPR